MRYFVNSAERPKAIARALRTEFESIGLTKSHTACLGIVAELYGYRSWRELEAQLGQAEPSLPDQDIPVEDAAARRVHHHAVLKRHGCDDAAIAGILNTVQPTARRAVPNTAPETVPAAVKENSWPDSPRQEKLGTAESVKSTITAMFERASRKARDTRLSMASEGGFVFSWSLNKYGDDELDIKIDGDKIHDHEELQRNYYISCHAGEMIAGRFDKDPPTRRIDIEDLPKISRHRRGEFSMALEAAGYLEDNPLQKISSNPAIQKMLKIMPLYVFHAFRACKNISNGDVENIRESIRAKDSLMALIFESPCLATLITYNNGISPWPVGLGELNKNLPNARASLADALSAGICTPEQMAGAFERCKNWIPDVEKPGMNLEGMQILALLDHETVPRTQEDIDRLVAIGQGLQNDEANHLTPADIVKDLQAAPWSQVAGKYQTLSQNFEWRMRAPEEEPVRTTGLQ